AVRRLPPPNYGANPPGRTAPATAPTRVAGAVTRSLRPSPRPVQTPAQQTTSDALMLALQSEIQNAVRAAQQDIQSEGDARIQVQVAQSDTARPTPAPRPEQLLADRPNASEPDIGLLTPGETDAVVAALQSVDLSGGADVGDSTTSQANLSSEIVQASVPPDATTAPEPAILQTVVIVPELRMEVQDPITVTRVSTSGGRLWGVNIGRFGSRYQAERVLLRTALREMTTLDGTLRRVVRQSSGFDANFVGMSQDTAELACRRLTARGMTCSPIGPT
ncbi:MAG: hypothetical protein ACC631_09195, partial [Halocynthiibacter sp.]